MKKQTIFVLSFIFIFSGFAFGQTKTITNKDLEKFRNKRLQAEKDLRENYAEMGFDSPEEITRQNEESRRELNELADKLRVERIARENQDNENTFYEIYDNKAYQDNGFINYNRYYSAGYFYGNGRYNRNRSGDRRFKPFKDFRQRFINGLPDFILRTHRFNTFNTPNFRPFRPTPRGKRNR